jgi:hypothetical protein
MREELKNLKTSDPKEYWKILNRGREKKQPDIPMEDLFNLFTNLLRMVIGRKFLGSKGLPLFLYIGLILPISQISGKKPVSKIKLNIFS